MQHHAIDKPSNAITPAAVWEHIPLDQRRRIMQRLFRFVRGHCDRVKINTTSARYAPSVEKHAKQCLFELGDDAVGFKKMMRLLGNAILLDVLANPRANPKVRTQNSD